MHVPTEFQCKMSKSEEKVHLFPHFPYYRLPKVYHLLEDRHIRYTIHQILLKNVENQKNYEEKSIYALLSLTSSLTSYQR